MKQLLTILITVITLNTNAQVEFAFDKRFVECEDRWVAFDMDEDSTFQFGFIYIDPEAGLTFDSKGSFTLKNNKPEVTKTEQANIKARLSPNNVKVAIIPKSWYTDLQIKSTPDWLKFYKIDLNTVKRQFKWGFMYNGWGECKKALPFLLDAYKADSLYQGLAVEIAYSYNCLQQYDKALKILEAEIQRNPTDAYINKEYIYSVSKTLDISKAILQFHKSVKVITEDIYNAENCFNIMEFFYKTKDRGNFSIWYKELKKWPINNPKMTEYAKEMKQNLKS